MESTSDNMDLWMENTLNRWAEAGELPAMQSILLQEMIAKLAYQERKKRMTRRTACGFIAAMMACLWLLFASCSVAAAAAYLGSTASHVQIGPSFIAGIMVIATCSILNRLYQSQYISITEVYHE